MTQMNIRCCCEPALCHGSIDMSKVQKAFPFDRLIVNHPGRMVMTGLPFKEANAPSIEHIPGSTDIFEVQEIVRHVRDIPFGNLRMYFEHAVNSNHKPQEYFEQLPGYQPVCILNEFSFPRRDHVL